MRIPLLGLFIFHLLGVFASGLAVAQSHQLFCDSILSGPPRAVLAMPPTSDQRWRVIVEEVGPLDLNFARADAFAEFLNGLNPAQKEAWISTMVLRYRVLPKFAPKGVVAFQPGPRRRLDRILSLTLRGDRKILSAIEGGLSPRMAYASYFTEMAKLFQSPFRVHELDRILSVLQNHVREESKTGAQGQLVVGGSLIDGRATLMQSDLDVGIRGYQSDHRRGGLVQSEIDEVLRETLPEAKLPLEVHAFNEKEYALLHPVVFVISAQHIEILIYPPAHHAQNVWTLEPAEPKRFIYD